jgi:AcrR family transcriptional regulator
MPRNNLRKPRTKLAQERREDLMNSAERLFLEKGMEQTAVEEITSGAAVAKGTFYLYFATKADVLEALRARFVQRVLDGIITEIGPYEERDWRSKLAAWCKACAAGYLDATRLHHLVFVATPPPTREGLARNILVDHLAELLEAGKRDNAWSVDDPRFAAVFLFNALHGVVNQTGIDASPGARAQLSRRLEVHFLRTLGLEVVRS